MKNIEGVFKNFLGNWELTRESHKTESGELHGHARGIAKFKPLNDKEYIFEETCTTVFPPSPMEHESNWEYRYKLDNQKIEVYHYGRYDDGLYLTYELNETADKLTFVETHECNRDNYEGFYELIDENQFNLITKQDGPKKGNLIKTTFRRLKS